MTERLPDHVELRPIPGYERYYAAAADGRIRSHSRCIVGPGGRTRRTVGKWLKPGFDPHGYTSVRLFRDGGVTQLLVHRLVAMAWLPPPGPGQDQVNHKDRNRSNNCASNLEWCTASENMLHGWQGRRMTDKARATLQRAAPLKRKLTDEQVLSIRTRVAAGELKSKLAAEMRVCAATITHVVSGRNYSHIPQGLPCDSN
jgi:hypothetical protein